MAVYGMTSGTFIVAGVGVAAFLGLVYGAFTYRGSGIDPHPHDGSEEAPGAANPSDPAGEGRTDDEGAFSTHGTK